MATNRLSDIVEHLRRTVPLRDGAGLNDSQLLENYISRRDEAALAALVWRHGPMVWSVCYRVLRNHHDAEDAFQATFLVFVRKAASIASRELLANWLYGVAFKTSIKARETNAKRKGRERQVTEMPEPAAATQDIWNELQPILDQELSRLPDKYRAVIVLCELDGKTRKEAARQLGVPEGTIASRMATARALLAKRLARNGLVFSGEVLAVTLTQNAVSAGVPMSVASSTIQAASLFAAGQAVATGVISPKVAALTQGVLQAMLLTKLKTAMTAIVLLALIGGGAILTSRAQEGKNDTAAAKQVKEDDKLKNVDVAQEPVPERSEARYEGKPIAYWIERLQKAEHDDVRNEAAQAIRAFGPDAGPAVPTLLVMLDDHSQKFRNLAAYIFWTIGGQSPKTAVPALVKSLKEGRARYPADVIKVIGDIGPDAKDAVPVLIQSLQDIRLWQAATESLFKIGHSAKEAAPAIGRAIRDARARAENLEDFFKSIDAVSQVQVGNAIQPRRAAIPLLAELLEEKDASLRSPAPSVGRRWTNREAHSAKAGGAPQERRSRSAAKRCNRVIAHREIRRGCSRACSTA